MSDVRLSSASPTLERMGARAPDQPRPSACRNLFGPVDRDELERDFQRHMKAMEDAAADAWNFDFSADAPRSGGRFRWEALDIRDVPGFYSSSIRRKGNNNDVDVNGNHDCAETPESPGDPRKTLSCVDSSCHSKRAHTCVDEVTRTPRKSKKPRRAPSPTPT